MHFFKNNIKENSDHLIPSYSLISEMKSDKGIYECRVSELAVNDIIFDIVFLRITSKKYNNSIKNAGYHFQAVNCLDQEYNSFIFEDKTVYFVNPERVESLINLGLYLV